MEYGETQYTARECELQQAPRRADEAWLQDRWEGCHVCPARRGIQRQKIYRKAYKIQARQRHESNLRKMAKRSRVARECREMRALAWELEPEWNARIGLFGNPNVKRKEYPWMRGRPKDSMIMRRRADEEGVDAMERYERLHKERSQRREEGWEKREERWRESRA